MNGVQCELPNALLELLFELLLQLLGLCVVLLGVVDLDKLDLEGLGHVSFDRAQCEAQFGIFCMLRQSGTNCAYACAYAFVCVCVCMSSATKAWQRSGLEA